ncbi:MAG: hypothetical protein J6Q65_05245 [Lentisphaeria bacterium]|nr:hypothetical protein [Lentisphaeria bacterium]
MKYLKVWTDFRKVISRLKPEEKGFLFDAMLHYAETGEEPDTLPANAFVLWPTAKRDIDHTAEESQKRSQNGSKGGRGNKAIESNEKQTKATESKTKQTEANESRKEKKGNEMKGNEMKSPFLGDDEAAGFQKDHDRVFLAAEDSGFKMSNAVRERLLALYADYGLEKMLAGFMECATHGVPTIAYLEAVLKGTGKKKAPVKVLPAQAFPQRDYSEVEKDLMEDLKRGIAAMKAGEAG